MAKYLAESGVFFVANFVNSVQTGNLLFLSGNGPLKADGKFITGKLGADLTIEEGYEAARITGINQLGVIKNAIGDLSRVKRIVRVTGMVNASPDFTQHPSVVNGFSDLMVAVFGKKGKHKADNIFKNQQGYVSPFTRVRKVH